jgi:hypothetical protein
LWLPEFDLRGTSQAKVIDYLKSFGYYEDFISWFNKFFGPDGIATIFYRGVKVGNVPNHEKSGSVGMQLLVQWLG